MIAYSNFLNMPKIWKIYIKVLEISDIWKEKLFKFFDFSSPYLKK
jgi:hypothetical protein